MLPFWSIIGILYLLELMFIMVLYCYCLLVFILIYVVSRLNTIYVEFFQKMQFSQNTSPSAHTWNRDIKDTKDNGFGSLIVYRKKAYILKGNMGSQEDK